MYASDCWSFQQLGDWPEPERERIADLLFSREVDGAGNPQGIGLSIWRFYLSAGTTELSSASSGYLPILDHQIYLPLVLRNHGP